MINMMRPGPDLLMKNALDIYEPKAVEVIQSEDGSRVWVNVDGICLLRIGGIPEKKKEFVTGRTVTGRMSSTTPNMEELPRKSLPEFERVRKALLDQFYGAKTNVTPPLVFGMDYGMGDSIAVMFAEMFETKAKKKTFVIGKNDKRTKELEHRHGFKAIYHRDQLIGMQDAVVVIEDGWEKRDDHPFFLAAINRYLVRTIPFSLYREIHCGER